MMRTLWVVLGCLLAATTVHADGIVVALAPEDSTVQPGSEFVVRLAVTASGPEFNAYDAVIGYDPNALTFLQQTPLSLQEGGTMKNACGLTFHLFSAAGDSLSISHSLLCGTPPVYLTGPGVLYKLRFRASETIQVTQIVLRFVQFYRGGVFVDLMSATDAVIGIGTTTDTAAVPSWTQLHVQAAPNPMNPSTTLYLQAPQAGHQALAVYDVRGRLVRQLQSGHFDAGERSVLWDGRSTGGAELASGIYLVTLEAEGQRSTTRVVLTR